MKKGDRGRGEERDRGGGGMKKGDRVGRGEER